MDNAVADHTEDPAHQSRTPAPSSPRRRRTRAEQQAETRARILEAAGEIFSAHGFTGASIDAITERAGYTRGAFYSNFESKEELLIALSQARMSAFAEDVLPRLADADDATIVRTTVDWMLEQGPPTELVLVVELSRLRATDPQAGAVVDRFLEGMLTFIDEAITRAVGSAPHDGDKQAARAVFAIIAGVKLLQHLDVGFEPATVETLLEAVLGLHRRRGADGAASRGPSDAPPSDA